MSEITTEASTYRRLACEPVRRAVAASTVMLIAACGVGTKPSGPGAELPTVAPSAQLPDVQTVDYIDTTLNYDGLRSDNLCQNGGERPCVAPVRKQPRFLKPGEDFTAHVINPGEFDEAGQYTSISWPYEASASRPGDNLRIVCRVTGDSVYGFEVEKASSIWNTVLVPADISMSGSDEVGYVPERWMQLAGGLVLDRCTSDENPANAPIATAPTKSEY